ncbi:MAG: hypothetical protein H5T98_06545 [Syntrophomonadaceae bacterium]|nr:hypothetical protein [Syntrophomonadaceae bacterium]
MEERKKHNAYRLDWEMLKNEWLLRVILSGLLLAAVLGFPLFVPYF